MATRTAKPDASKLSSERTAAFCPALSESKHRHDFVHVALDDAGVLIGEGRALRRDDVLHARHEARDGVQLPLAHDGETGVEDGALGFIEREERLCSW
jgi:hypothetical protein